MQNKHYFSHDSDAHNDSRIIKLRMEFGWEGYGVYWAIIEVLRDEKNYQLDDNYTDILSFRLSIAKALLEQICSNALASGLFIFQGQKFYSESLKTRMEDAESRTQKRRDAGKKGAAAKAMLKQNSSNAEALKETKVNKSKVKEAKEKDKTKDQNTKSFKNFTKDDLSKEVYDKKYSVRHGKPMLDAFIVYWTEPNASGKMRFQLEKTWSTSGRISRWASNNFNGANPRQDLFQNQTKHIDKPAGNYQEPCNRNTQY